MVRIEGGDVSVFLRVFITSSPVLLFYLDGRLTLGIAIILALCALIALFLVIRRSFILFIRFLIFSCLLITWCFLYKSIIINDTLALPLEKANITTIRGVIIRSPSHTKGGKLMITLRLSEISDNNLGIRADASGVMNVIVDDSQDTYEGDEITAYGIKFISGLCFSSNIKKHKRENVSVLTYIYDLRNAFVKDASEHILTMSPFSHSSLSNYARSLSRLLIFSKTTRGGSDIKDRARSVGLSHVFALSGMHLNLISGFLLMIASKFVPLKKRRRAILPFLMIYTFLCGTSPSLIRAFLMMAVLTLIPSLKDYSLFLSLFIQTILFKSSVNSMAFVLSYTCTVALVYITEMAYYALTFVCPHNISRYLSSGCAVLILSSPLSILSFANASIGSVFLTSVATMLVSINMIGGFIAILIPGSIVASFLMEGSYYLLSLMIDLFSKIRLTYSWSGYVIFVLGLIILTLLNLHRGAHLKREYYL